MHRLLFDLLLIFSSVGVAVLASAHGARMAAETQVMESKHVSQHSMAKTAGSSCEKYQDCKTSDALCSFVCAGMVTLFTPEKTANNSVPLAPIRAVLETLFLDGLGPQRTERPPDNCLS